MTQSTSVFQKISGIAAELKRRRVFRVAIVYLAGGWLLIEVSATIPEALGLPEWILPLVIVLVGLGLPLALGLAWAYDLEVRAATPGGGAPSRLARGPSPGVAPGERERGVAAGTIRSIAVLPFANVSADEDNEYFSDGITEELLSTLSRVGGLRVAARSSVFALKGQDLDPRDVGQRLEVAAVLAGSVRSSQGRLRIAAELVDAGTGYRLWSERYDRQSGDIFAIQEDISRAIADALRIRLLDAAAGTALYRQPTPSLEAYHQYLKGRFHLNRRTRDSLRAGRTAFQRAIEADPTFARAYSGLADTYMLLERYGVLPAEESVPEAEAAARRALEIDPELAEAHNSLAYTLMIGYWDWAAADRAFRRAVELDPSYAAAHHWRGWHLARLGRSDEALVSMQRALELEPLSLIINANLGTIHYFARRYDDAIRQLQATLELNPDFPVAHQWIGRALDRAGRTGEAVEAQRRAVELLPGDPESIASLGHALARNDETKAAAAELAELDRLAGEKWVSSYWQGLVLMGLGRVDEAVRSLEQAYDERFDWIVFIAVDPLFDPLRDVPAFRRLVDRIG